MHFLSRAVAAVQKYRWRIVGAGAGLFAGFWGACAGFSAGLFADVIVRRVREERQLKIALENPEPRTVGEPFSGSSLLAALTVFCCRDPALASVLLKRCFPLPDSAVWDALCRSAASAESLNGDLLAECLAAVLQKKAGSAAPEQVFTLLAAAEFGWDTASRGTKPSAYLAELLQYGGAATEIAPACMLLGVKITDSSAHIRKTYRKLAAAWHPDSVRDLTAGQQKLAAEAFLRIRQAYAVLCESRGFM